ncbi:MAG: transporter [Flavobacteriaceae bacterium]
MKLLLFFSLFFLSVFGLKAQGCVAIKHFSCSVGNSLESNLLNEGSFQLGVNYRYFKSFRHFRGTEEEPDRVANETEVVNHSHSWDFSINYGITKRMYLGITIPTVINTRSSLYEHGRNSRHITYSRGLGDIRVGVGYWILNPETHENGNIALGAGIKLPTGDYNAADIFYNVGVDGRPEVRPVDQSIQPGDGGFGFTIDFQVYQKMATDFYAYAGGFYLLNPRDINETRTFRETLSPVLQNEAIMSVPDQFSLRGGFSYTFSGTFSSSLGARYEGIPVEDLIGDSNGFRRPGNVLSIDPGITFRKNNFSLNLNVPIAVRRERPQSLTDIETSNLTGQFRNGDAAFADYLINLGISYSFSGKKIKEMEQSSNIEID